jgi:hypothetical protein
MKMFICAQHLYLLRPFTIIKQAQEIDIWISTTLFYVAKANSDIPFLIACLKASSREYDITD